MRKSFTDGALTGGMAYEAMSNAGHLKANLLVVLNDNRMSISESVGALSTSLSRVITAGLYNRAKGDLKTFMQRAMGKHVTDAARSGMDKHVLAGTQLSGIKKALPRRKRD